MANTDSPNPFRNFRFRVEIDGILTAAFSEATMVDSTTDSFDYREGTDPNYPRKLSGLTKFGNLSLKKGVTGSLELYEWRRTVQDRGAEAPGARRNVSVVLVDDEGQDAARWNLYNCWPSKYENTGMNASSSEVLIETLEIAVESMARVG
jgi:phage tail-like protein